MGKLWQACVSGFRGLGFLRHPGLMAGLNSIDDSNWAEVKYINCYAMFMGLLWMAMRGLGLLVVTWTTVILLGGFVSMLDTTNFWCLTVIALVQTAGVFNTHPSENLLAIPRLCLNFLRTMNFTIAWKGAQVRSYEESISTRLRGHLCVGARKSVAFGVALIQAMAFSIILCPVAALYGIGQYITTGVALWRLIEQDYGTSSSGGQTSNMNPALGVLYLLAVLQGGVFCYRGLLRLVGKNIVNQVTQVYKFEQGYNSPVLGYLNEVRVGCETDPWFVTGRNLITYALDLMELESPDDLLSGTRILDTLITYDNKSPQSPDRQEERNCCRRTPMVTERLIGSSSSGTILQKLLKALDSRSSSPCDTEMRKRAARIVYALAGDIRLKQFPGGIGCISSLLDASLYQDMNEYQELMLHGLHIIEKLATEKDNCRVMSDTDDLVSMIMRPLSCDLLHRFDHDEWSEIVDASLQVLCCWLNTVVGDNRKELHQEISRNLEAISAMQSILACDVCRAREKRHVLVIKVLITQLYKDDGDKVVEVQLLDIFIHYKGDEYITILAGEKLVMLSKESRNNAGIILNGNESKQHLEAIVSLLCSRDGMNKSRICAAGILEGLCSHYTTGVDCFEALKTLILTELMPKVVTQIFPHRLQAHIDIPTYTFSPDALHVPQALSHEAVQTLPHEVLQKLSPQVLQNLPPDLRMAINAKIGEEIKLQVALLSLWLIIYDKMITPGEVLPSVFANSGFPRMLTEMVERNSDSNKVDCLRILNLVAKITISMMRHKSSYDSRDLENLIASLKDASTVMINLDAFVHLSGSDGGDFLSSLVQEANELFHTRKEAQQPEDISAPYATFEHGQSSSS